MTFTAKGKNETFAVCLQLIRILEVAVNSKRHFSIFVIYLRITRKD